MTETTWKVYKGKKLEEMDMVILNKVVDSKKHDVNQGVKLPFVFPPGTSSGLLKAGTWVWESQH